MEHRLSDILRFAPKNLQLYYKSSKLEQTVYFDEVYEHNNGRKYIIVNKDLLEINVDSDKEFIESSKLMILDSALTKSNLFPSEEYLSWVNWQYILFPKSVGSVICGLDDKYFYIINDSEMIDENKVIFNMCIDSLPIFKYVDINETKFKDMDCSELISKRDDLINETLIKAINNVTQTEEVEKPEETNEQGESEKSGLKESSIEETENLEKRYSDFNLTYIDENFGNGEKFINFLKERLKYCKTADDIIKAISTMFGSDPEECNVTRINYNIWYTIIMHMMENGINAKPYGPKDFMEQVYSFISNNVTQKTESENTDKPDAEFLNNTDGFVFIDSDWIEMIKDCKSKEEVIRVFSDKYGSDYVQNIEKFIPNYWESVFKCVNKNKDHE